MKKWAIYARCSTEEQAKEGYSIEMQISNCMQLINSMDDAMLYKTYIDEGISGSDSYLKRSGLLNLLADARKKRFDGIVLYRADRLTRLSQENEELVHLFLKYGIQIKCYSGENLMDTSPMGEFFRRTIANINELEVKILSFRIKSAMKLKAENGEWKGNRLPYGYYYDHETQTIKNVDDELEQVKFIYKLYTENLMGAYKIRDYLNDNNIFYHNKEKWTRDRVLGILSNPLYCGYQWHNKRYSKFEIKLDNKKFKDKNNWILYPANFITPIISKDKWDEVQKIKELRAKKLLNTHTNSTWLLSGILYCGCCGEHLQGHPIINSRRLKRTGEIKYYDCSNYICTGRRMMGNDYCKARQVAKRRIENIVISKTIKYIEKMSKTFALSKQEIEKILDEKFNLKGSSNIDLQIKQIEKKIDKYYQDYESGKIDAEILNPAVKRLNYEMENLLKKKEEQSNIESQKIEMLNKILEYNTNLSIWKNELLTKDNNIIKPILLKLINYVEVLNTGTDLYCNINFKSPYNFDLTNNHE